MRKRIGSGSDRLSNQVQWSMQSVQSVQKGEKVCLNHKPQKGRENNVTNAKHDERERLPRNRC